MVILAHVVVGSLPWSKRRLLFTDLGCGKIDGIFNYKTATTGEKR